MSMDATHCVKSQYSSTLSSADQYAGGHALGRKKYHRSLCARQLLLDLVQHHTGTARVVVLDGSASARGIDHCVVSLSVLLSQC